MQQLKVEHKKTANNNQNVVEKDQVEQEYKNKREGKGRVLAISRRIYRLSNSGTYYVESESSDNLYYFVKYNTSVFEWCSCPDNSTRGQKCKHQFAIEHSIRLRTLKDIEKLPVEAKRYPATTTVASIAAKSYRDDDYDF